MSDKNDQSFYESILEERAQNEPGSGKKKKGAKKSGKASKVVLIILTVLKSLLSLLALALTFVIFGLISKADENPANLFAIFLVAYLVIIGGAAYLLSIICMLINFFSAKIYGKWWSIISIAAIVAIIVLIVVNELCGGFDEFTYVFCVVFGLQSVPVIFEAYTLEKHLADKRKKRLEAREKHE